MQLIDQNRILVGADRRLYEVNSQTEELTPKAIFKKNVLALMLVESVSMCSRRTARLRFSLFPTYNCNKHFKFRRNSASRASRLGLISCTSQIAIAFLFLSIIMQSFNVNWTIWRLPISSVSREKFEPHCLMTGRFTS